MFILKTLLNQSNIVVTLTFLMSSSRLSCSWARLELLPARDPGAICFSCLATEDKNPSLEKIKIKIKASLKYTVYALGNALLERERVVIESNFTKLKQMLQLHEN